MPAILVILLVLAIVTFVPLATIWALNTLFALGIVYTFYTWLSVLILNVTILGVWSRK